MDCQRQVLALLFLPTLVALAQNVFDIQVGAEASSAGHLGIYQFIPSNITASVGDTINFRFNVTGNHSVTQSSFASPCTPLSGGFNSGFLPVSSAVDSFPQFSLTITDGTPVWFYCQQLLPASHCSAGMVGAINAPTTGNTFQSFSDSARSLAQSAAGSIQQSTSSSPFTGGSATLSGASPTTTSGTGTANTVTPDAASETSAPSSKSLAGPIAGGVLGGLGFLILTVLVILFYRRKKLQQPRQLEDARRMSLTSNAARTYETSHSQNGLPRPNLVVESTNSGSLSQVPPSNSTTNLWSRKRQAPPSDSAMTSPPANATSESGAGNRSRGEEIPIPELVRLLIERLQPGQQWNEDMPPPEYQSSLR